MTDSNKRLKSYRQSLMDIAKVLNPINEFLGTMGGQICSPTVNEHGDLCPRIIFDDEKLHGFLEKHPELTATNEEATAPDCTVQ